MSTLQGYGWLMVGATLAVVVPILAVDQFMVEVLTGLAPLPWARLGLGALVFWAVAALYFRSHWSATLGLLQAQRYQYRRAAERLKDIAADTERTAYLLADNLEEIDLGDGGETRQSLYLEGARAHAAKVAQVAQRCRLLSDELTAHRSATARDTE